MADRGNNGDNRGRDINRNRERERERERLNGGRPGRHNNYANAGGARAISRSANADRYRERVRREQEQERNRKQTFPNRRRKIITGKDLTTPLRGRARVTGHKKVAVNVKTVYLPKEKMPWGLIFKLLVCAGALCFLIYSYIVLFDVDSRINATNNMIRSERMQTEALERQYLLENDPTESLRIAREEFGMVEERFIQKHHIRSRRENRAVIIQEENNFLPEIFSIIFRRNR